MVIACHDYGFDCDFCMDGQVSLGAVEELRDHFEDKQGKDGPVDVVMQMIVNKGYSIESIKTS